MYRQCYSELSLSYQPPTDESLLFSTALLWLQAVIWLAVQVVSKAQYVHWPSISCRHSDLCLCLKLRVMTMDYSHVKGPNGAFLPSEVLAGLPWPP